LSAESLQAADYGWNIGACSEAAEQLVDGVGVVSNGVYLLCVVLILGTLSHGRRGSPLRFAVLHETAHKKGVRQCDNGTAESAATAPVQGHHANVTGVQLERMLDAHGYGVEGGAGAEIVGQNDACRVFKAVPQPKHHAL
jgi:hypothetical protein